MCAAAPVDEVDRSVVFVDDGHQVAGGFAAKMSGAASVTVTRGACSARSNSPP